MKLPEYVRTIYPIKDIVMQIKMNPIKLIAEQDDLPYDSIRQVDGEFRKVVEFGDSDGFIPVIDLVSLTEEDLTRINNPDLTALYRTYMTKVEVLNLDFQEILQVSKAYRQRAEEKDRWLSYVCN